MSKTDRYSICHLFLSPLRGESRLYKELATAEQLFPAETLLSIGIDKGVDDLSGTLQGRYPCQRIRLVTANLPKSLPFQLIKFMEWTFRAAKRARGSGARILHCHSLAALPATVLASLFSSSRRVLYDAHELETKRANTSRARQWGMVALEWLLMPFVDKVLVVSPSIEAHYRRAYPAKQLSLLMNMPSEKQSGPGVDLRSSLGIPLREPIVLYVGALAPMRGIELLLEVAKTQGTWHYVFLGDGPLAAQIHAESAVNLRVHHHPPVPERDIVKTVESANLSYSVIDCSMASYRFALPNKFFQSLAAGVPVLVNSQNVDMRSVGEKTGMVFAVDFDADAIRRFIATFSARHVLTKPQDFSWERQENVLVSAYRRLLGEGDVQEETRIWHG